MIVLLLVAAGVGVHLWFIPLDVLIAWRQPTGLSITTEPPGAKLRVDGVPLAATAPTTVTVWRDRTDHTVEATLVGYQLARETIRYDKSATLSYVVRLPKDPNYIPPAAVGGARGAVGGAAAVARAPDHRGAGQTLCVGGRSRFGRCGGPGRAHSGRGGGGRRRRGRWRRWRDDGGGLDGAGRGRRSRHCEVGAQVPHHLAADAVIRTSSSTVRNGRRLR